VNLERVDIIDRGRIVFGKALIPVLIFPEITHI